MTNTLKFRQHRAHSFVVDRGSVTVGIVWKGCGGWAGSRYANGIEVTASSRKQAAEQLAAKPPLYDRIVPAPFC